MATPNPLLPHAGEAWFAADAMWWRTACAGFDRVAATTARRLPAETFSAAASAGRLAHTMQLSGPQPAEVGTIFPSLSPPARRRIAREISALRVRNRTAIALVHRHGLDALAPVVDAPSTTLRELSACGRPVLLVTWHVGSIFGLGAALHQMGLPAVILRNLPLASSADRTRAMWKALHQLRSGGLVVAMLDGPGGSSTAPVSCLGRRVVFRRGPFMLAQTTGAAMVPFVTWWRPRGRIGITIGTPLSAADTDPEMDAEQPFVDASARWLERYLLEAPDQIWLYTLRNLISAPPLSRWSPR